MDLRLFGVRLRKRIDALKLESSQWSENDYELYPNLDADEIEEVRRERMEAREAERHTRQTKIETLEEILDILEGE